MTLESKHRRWVASRLLIVLLCAGCASMMPSTSHWRLGQSGSEGLLPEPELGESENLGDDAIPFPITEDTEQDVSDGFSQIPSEVTPSDESETEVRLPELSRPTITPSDITVPAVLKLEISAPVRKQVGSGVTYRLVLHNTGDEVASDVVVESEFDDALVFPGRAEKQARQKIGRILANSTRDLALTLISNKQGRQCCRFRILQGDEEIVWKEVCVDFLPQMLEVDLVGPATRTVKSNGEYTVSLRNTSSRELTDLIATLIHDRAMSFVAASGDNERKSSSVVWKIPKLAPGESIPLQAEFSYSITAEHACMQLDVIGADIPDYQKDLCLEVVPVRGVLDVQVSDTRDLLSMNQQSEFVVQIHNEGLQPIRKIKLDGTIPENCRVIAAYAKVDGKPIDIAYSEQKSAIIFDAIDALNTDESLTFHIQVSAAKSGNGWFQAKVTHSDAQSPVSARELLTVK